MNYYCSPPKQHKLFLVLLKLAIHLKLRLYGNITVQNSFINKNYKYCWLREVDNDSFQFSIADHTTPIYKKISPALFIVKMITLSKKRKTK